VILRAIARSRSPWRENIVFVLHLSARGRLLEPSRGQGDQLRLQISIFLASVLAHGAAHASGDQILRRPAPNWVVPSELMPIPKDASGLIFVRHQDILVHLGEQGQEQYLGYRIKILHSKALQLGNLSIARNPAAGTPTVHTIRIYRDNGTIDILRDASV